jgi:hypothetical protein
LLADDERNPPQTGIAEREIKRTKVSGARMASKPEGALQVTSALISASVGNRPSICFEQTIRSWIRISKIPPPDPRSITSASGRTLRMRFAASRARGS